MTAIGEVPFENSDLDTRILTVDLIRAMYRVAEGEPSARSAGAVTRAAALLIIGCADEGKQAELLAQCAKHMLRMSVRIMQLSRPAGTRLQ